MSTKVFEDKSVEAALEKAATTFGVPAEDLEYEVINEGTGDFWGLGDTVYSVRAWQRGSDPVPDDSPDVVQEVPEADGQAVAVGESECEETAEASDDTQSAEPTRTTGIPAFSDTTDADADAGDADGGLPHTTLEPAQSPPAEGDLPAFFRVADETAVAEPIEVEQVATISPVTAPSEEQATSAGADLEEARSPRAGGADVSDEAADLLAKIFETMGFDCEAEARIDGQTMQIAITGDDNQYLLDGRGRGLSALELILNHAFRHRSDRSHRRVRVDAGDFRSQRDDEIRDMAYQVAHQAKETDSPQQTGPLNPYERRIVHLTLAEDSKVKTRSIGNGFQKAVNVIPTQGGRRH